MILSTKSDSKSVRFENDEIHFFKNNPELSILKFSEGNHLKIFVGENIQAKTLIEIDTENLTIEWFIKENAVFENFIFSKNLKTVSQIVTVEENGNLKIREFFIDVISQDLKHTAFLKKSCNYEFLGAVIASNKTKKEFDFTIHNLKPDIFSNVKIYGVSKDRATINLHCNNVIAKGQDDVSTHQTLKTILLNDKAKATVEPILTINHNNVQASHAAAVGQIPEDKFFYLMSRGLSKEEAKKLIIMGYFNPILEKISDETIINKIQKQITKELFL